MPNPFAELDAFWDAPFVVRPEEEPAQLRELVRYASLAPNAHNTQAWQFELGTGSIRMFPDFSRSMPIGDPGDRELWISLGCALEHLVLAARRVGYAPTVDYVLEGRPEPFISVTFGNADPVTEDPLFDAIPRRHSNRRSYDGKSIPASDLDAVAKAIEHPGIRAHISTERSDIERLIDVAESGFDWQRSSKEFQAELASWIRFSKGAILANRDGLSSRATGRPTIPDAIGRALVRFLSITGLEQREIVGKIRSSSATLMLVTDDNDLSTWISAGRALARVKLQATARGMVCAHLNNNWQWEATKAPAQQALELGEAHPQATIRLGYADPLPHAPRRRIDAVIRSG